MEIVVSTYHLGLGGTESYTLTVAEQLQRLGHDVTVFYVEPNRAVLPSSAPRRWKCVNRVRAGRQQR